MQDNTSIKYLLGNCIDFEEEESLLQSNGRIIGVLIDFIPKCHTKLTGKGIEYIGGFVKNYYHRQYLNLKRKKETFRKLVSGCLSRDKCTKEGIQLFSKDYILS